jgi:hypothetical protein
MEGVLIGIIWLVVIVGGVGALAAIIQLAKSPFRGK